MAFPGQQDRRLTLALAKGLRRMHGRHLDIVEVGNPVLRARARPYHGQIGAPVFHKLLDAMRSTMLDAPGVGLAAPQIGLPFAFAVVEDHTSKELEGDPREFDEFPFHAIINPKYEPVGDRTASFYEGCLSVPGVEAVRRRWLDIVATWQDENGRSHEQKLHGWPARIFQHETDHLDGELYIDKCEIRSLSTDDNIDEYWDSPSPSDAAEAMGFEI